MQQGFQDLNPYHLFREMVLKRGANNPLKVPLFKGDLGGSSTNNQAIALLQTLHSSIVGRWLCPPQASQTQI